MKKTISTIVIAAVVSVAVTAGTAQAGLWTKLSGMFAETVPSKMFAIEAQGFNIRGYVYELKAVGKTCVFNATDGGAGGLACFDTPAE